MKFPPVRLAAPLFLALLSSSLLLAGCGTKNHRAASGVEGKSEEKVETATETNAEAQWRAWRSRSDKLRALDMEAIRRELEQTGREIPPGKDPRKLLAITKGSKDFGLDLEAPVEFYRSAEGRRIADNVLTYQTASGGWSKNVDMSAGPRAPGNTYGPRVKGYQPTFDNDGTSTQLRFLARAFTATKDPRYRDSFLRGLELILSAQMPNGGWPQSYPLDGGYHDLLTYNDDSTVELLELLRAVAGAEPDYRFVPEAERARTQRALARGVEGLLASQVRVDGRRTIWGAQQDPLTLELAPARAFEPAALSSSESTKILLFLMEEPNPPAELVQAVEAAMEWFRATRIDGLRWDRREGLVPDPDTKPIWARFYDPATSEPLFGDRDGAVYNDVMQLSEERRLGYGWYRTAPAKLEKHYRRWRRSLATD
ncbi:pectate lyase [Microbulbifer sp.]|uniref:pectate lyase n=1 Tax=Microbulbifer sp. TaxID=1908541 RepID=UPI003F34D0F4